MDDDDLNDTAGQASKAQSSVHFPKYMWFKVQGIIIELEGSVLLCRTTVGYLIMVYEWI